MFQEYDLQDCLEVKSKLSSEYREGIYIIGDQEMDKSQVYCDPEGWTVIQSRGQFKNRIDYFYRDWDEYLKGFGTPGNFELQHRMPCNIYSY